jgi:hypothetical protein
MGKLSCIKTTIGSIGMAARRVRDVIIFACTIGDKGIANKAHYLGTPGAR